MRFEIKEGIPMSASTGKPRKYDLPLETMKSGDSILIELPKTKIHAEVKIIRNFVLRFKHDNPNTNFTVRMVDDGVGVWKL